MKIQYDNHTSHYQDISLDKTRVDLAAASSDGTMNIWRQERTLGPLVSLFTSEAGKTWLTVGDGAFGMDAVRLAHFGIADVHASDLTADLLVQAAEKGLIKKFSAQNAEAMSFTEGAFDFVFCRDSFHHFPRPMLAVYEMLRVCRQGTILVEPVDPGIGFTFRSFIRKLLGKSFHDFEDVGNYVYYVSEREFEKLMLGLGLRFCAFKTCNDMYVPGMEHIPEDGGTFANRIFRIRVRLKGLLRDALSLLKIIPPNCLITVLFKDRPTAQQTAILGKSGFRVRELPLNPYR